MTPNNKIRKKSGRKKLKKHRKSWKQRTRGNCEAEASQQKKKQNSEDPSGSIRDITAHLIHEKYLDSSTLYSF